MICIFMSLCLIVSSFGGLIVIPEVRIEINRIITSSHQAKYPFCLVILIELAVILSVLAKNKCCISLFIFYKVCFIIISISINSRSQATSFFITLLSGFPMGYALITVEKPAKDLAKYLNDVKPEGIFFF